MSLLRIILNKSCDRERIRTFDRLLRRQMLYPAELRDRILRGKYTISSF